MPSSRLVSTASITVPARIVWSGPAGLIAPVRVARSLGADGLGGAVLLVGGTGALVAAVGAAPARSVARRAASAISSIEAAGGAPGAVLAVLDADATPRPLSGR